jgi:hypothetical protein
MEIVPRFVAKSGYFPAWEGRQNPNQGAKWRFPEIRVLFFIEMLSYGPKKGVIGG